MIAVASHYLWIADAYLVYIGLYLWRQAIINRIEGEKP